MAYILKDKIKIDKPIIFLCGPYYNGADKSDRRKILKDFFLEKFPKKCMPLIIDDFLTEENIGDESVSIQLLEEIFAGISHRTYIFLDTMSAAVELGLFTNSAYNNSLFVMIPYEKERNCGTIGAFTKDIVLEDNADRVKTAYYHPKIERVAFSTDYVSEFYKFINDRLPCVLANDILQDYTKDICQEYEISLTDDDSYPKDDYCINYQYDKKENRLVVFMSVKLLFYIIAGIVYSEYADNLVKEENRDKLNVNHYNIDNAISHLKSIVLAFILKHTFLGINGGTHITIQTVLVKDIDEVVKHIVTFIFTYHKKGRVEGYFFVGKNEIIKELDLKVNPTDFFHLNADDIHFVKSCQQNSSDYFRVFELRSASRKREIVTYADNEYGQNMRKFHEKIAFVLNKEHIFSENSYAYQKGKSIKNCVECHKSGNTFLKFDIHHFFNSIEKKKLIKILMQEFELDIVYKKQIELILDTCFYKEKMPIGLVTSPVLSDLYMGYFDHDFTSDLGESYVYTRYADDILISCLTEISQQEEVRIKKLLKTKLSKLGLALNEKKYMRKRFTKDGDFIKYLGVNLVRHKEKNIITVGKAYKNYIAKCYLQYVRMEKDTEGRFFFGKKIAGYISFVKQIEGEAGLNKIFNRIEKSTQGRIIIHDKINNL